MEDGVTPRLAASCSSVSACAVGRGWRRRPVLQGAGALSQVATWFVAGWLFSVTSLRESFDA